MTEEREAKRAYKEAFAALEETREYMDASTREEERLRRDLLASFEDHLKQKVTTSFLLLH